MKEPVIVTALLCSSVYVLSRLFECILIDMGTDPSKAMLAGITSCVALLIAGALYIDLVETESGEEE